MELPAVVFFCLLLGAFRDVYADTSLAELDTRVRVVERYMRTWKLSAVNSETKLNNGFKKLETSLKELIKHLAKQAIAEIMTEEYIENITCRHVLDQVDSIKSDLQNITTQLKTTRQELKEVERERDTYREHVRNVSDKCNEDMGALRLQVNQTIDDATSYARMLRSQLNQTIDDLSHTKSSLSCLTEDFMALNNSCVMMGKEADSYREGLQEIQLQLPTDIQSLTSQLNQTKEDLLDSKEVITGLAEDFNALNLSCLGMRKYIKESADNEDSSVSQMSLTALTTTFLGTTTASTDPSPSNTVPQTAVTAQDLQASTTDASENLTPSKTVPPPTVTTQVSDAHATPSPARNRDLYDASKDGDLERVKRILAAGHVNINARGVYSRTPVLAAAVYRHGDVVELLVGRGADVSLVDRWGNNILHYACYGGDLGTVELILSLDKLDVNARNNMGQTAADSEWRISWCHVVHTDVSVAVDRDVAMMLLTHCLPFTLSCSQDSDDLSFSK